MKKLLQFSSLALLSLSLGLLAGITSSSAATVEQTIYCPDDDAQHDHGFENTTRPSSGYESYFIAHKLRIYLHDDFMDSVDLSTLECSTPEGWVSCDGGRTHDDPSDDEDYGGVSVELVQNDTSSSAVYPDYIEWTYGVDESTEKPFVPGKNDYDGNGTVDNTAEERDMGESVFYHFNGDESSASATTTAALYVQFWQYDQDCGSFGSSSCWEAVEEDGSTGKHWNNNDTDTVRTNYECESVTCESLSISPDTGDLDINDVFTDVPFTLTATGSDGSDITSDSEFTYSINKYGSANDASDADGTLRYGTANFRSSKNPTTSDSTVTFQDTEPGDTLYAYVSDYNGTDYENTCAVEVELPYCTDLTITDPGGRFSLPYIGTVSDETYTTNIDIDTETSTGQAWPFNVTYESTDSAATFDGNLSPYTTTDQSILNYTSTDSATVNIGLDDQNGDGESDDVANACSDHFYYTLVPPIELLTCESLEITTPVSPVTAEAMEDGNVEISWESYLTDGSRNPGPYICTSSNAAGQFRDLSGMTSTGMITTPLTTVFYTGEPGDTITCLSTAPYSGPTCIDTITSETTTGGPVCEDLSFGTPYITEDDGTQVELDLSDESDLETLYENDTVCYPFTVNTEADFEGDLQASNDGSGIMKLYVDGIGETQSDPSTGNVATLSLSGSTSYTGVLCWENFEEGETLSLEVAGSESVCADTVTLPSIVIIIDDDDDDDDDDHHRYTCEDVVEVEDTDEGGICEEYSMELCVEDEDVEVVSEGDEICYYDEDDTDHSDAIECDEDSLTIESSSRRTCYDVVVEGNVCDADVSVEYNGETCFEEEFEQKEVGVLNKYIYTFNFISNKVYNSDEEVFFTHDEDRTFYTLEYTPAGNEDTLVFTDDMWDSDGIQGIFGSTGNDSGGSIDLAASYEELTDYQYEYKTIKSFGFGDKEEGSQGLADYVAGFNSSNYDTFIPYLKYDDSSDPYSSERVYACAPSTDEDGNTVYGEDGMLCYNPEYTPEDDGRVVIVNADAIPSDATLRIRYVGVIDSGMTDECDERDDECLTEIFDNGAKVFANPDDVEDPQNDDSCSEDEGCSEDSAKLVVLCSYLMTQNAGDIYLEGDLDSGSDISCAYIDDEQNYSSYSNTDGLVILDADNGEDDTSSSSSDDDDDDDVTYNVSSSSSEVSVCDDSNGDNAIGNLSSYVCEIIAAVSDLWKTDSAQETTNSHVSQAVRNADTNQASSNERYSGFDAMKTALTNKNNPDSGILYFEGDGNGSTITLTGNFDVACGAWTLIVQDAQLNIATDIQYATGCSANNLPSIAFVVEGGDIYIEDSAYHLVGVYYTDQDINGDHRSAVDGALTFDGSIYGNIDPLLDQADYVGPPTLDGGSVVVRYDSRILLNTPPALSEYVDVDTEKGVN